jgi:hypothetical protein
MKTTLIVLTVLAFVGWLLAGSLLSYKFVSKQLVVEGDIDRWFTRAQVSAEVEDMIIYLDKTEQGLDKWGMREGHSGLIVRNAGNDMAEIRKNLDNIQKRAVQLAQTPVEERGRDAAYQTGLDDLRGTIRELSIPALGYYWRHDGLPVALGQIFVWSFGWLFAASFGVAAFWPSKRKKKR